jgi:tetratricopeptide (TPR) repeat protein
MKKGQVNLEVGEIELAKEFMATSALLSNTNANISIAIKLALNSHTSKANKLFARLNEKFENHDTLEYNLGLSFAQLGNYRDAYDHFRRAQFLNKSNVLAGVFALFCADMSGKGTEHIEKKLKSEIQGEEESIEKVFHQTLFNLYKDNFNAMFRWLEIEKEQDPLYLLTEVLVADRINKGVIAQGSADDLLKEFPNDIVTNILQLYVANKNTNVKKYAFQTQQFMARQNLSFDSLYYGPDIARDLYILMGQISGNLPKIKILLERQMRQEIHDRENLLKALGLTNILLRNFEQAFVQYNQLIDELKISDTKTLLYAAIAAIGAGHKENAIVLLEVAKMTDPRNFEARYGLGLLHQEVKNYPAAAIQYGKINSDKYQSRYFDFRIKEKED